MLRSRVQGEVTADQHFLYHPPRERCHCCKYPAEGKTTEAVPGNERARAAPLCALHPLPLRRPLRAALPAPSPCRPSQPPLSLVLPLLPPLPSPPLAAVWPPGLGRRAARPPAAESNMAAGGELARGGGRARPSMPGCWHAPGLWPSQHATACSAVATDNKAPCPSPTAHPLLEVGGQRVNRARVPQYVDEKVRWVLVHGAGEAVAEGRAEYTGHGAAAVSGWGGPAASSPCCARCMVHATHAIGPAACSGWYYQRIPQPQPLGSAHCTHSPSACKKVHRLLPGAEIDQPALPQQHVVVEERGDNRVGLVDGHCDLMVRQGAAKTHD